MCASLGILLNCWLGGAGVNREEASNFCREAGAWLPLSPWPSLRVKRGTKTFMTSKMEKLNQLGYGGSESEFIAEAGRQGYDSGLAKRVYAIVQRGKADTPRAMTMADLSEIANRYREEIQSGQVEEAIQARLLKAISGDDLANMRTFASALVKARICKAQLQRGAAVSGSVFGVETIDWRELASTIGSPTDLPAHLGGPGKKHDAWDTICLRILQPGYPG
jgi:hypothetical protein